MAEKLWYKRYYEDQAAELLQPGKVTVIYGPRRSGKTELIKRIIGNFEGRIYSGKGDDMDLQSVFAMRSQSRFSALFSQYDLLFLDEAQYLPEVGAGLKLLVDSYPAMTIVVSGSSSFQLSGKLGEPLTGRQRIRILFPISAMELHMQFGGMELISKKDELLIFGSYPETLQYNSFKEKQEYLLSLRNAYLFKDILQFDDIKYSLKISDLLKMLAFQIGHEVSVNELANALAISRQTVERYLDLLEKTFIIKRVTGFSRNLRSEITKTVRYYFWDNGIRNALINNFNLPGSRNDIGMLWENFLFIERIKKQEYQRIFSNNYFWRTYTRQEIDLIEEREGKLAGYEFKWGPKKSKPPRLWLDTYPEASFETINGENFLEFIT